MPHGLYQFGVDREVKKIFLYIDSMQRGGANRVMANLAEYFDAEGYAVTLVNDILPVPGILEYSVPDGVERAWLKASSPNALLKNFSRIRALRKLLRKDKPDVLISFMGPPNIRALTAAIGLPVRTLVSVRNDPYREYGTGLRKVLAGMWFRLSDGVIFQTGDAASYFPRGIQKKSKIIFNPVNREFYQRKWKDGSRRIVVIGRLQPQKNPMLAIRSFLAVSSQLPEHTLHFYGDGDLRPELEAYVKERRFDDRIFFYGKTDDVGSVLENAALYVLSSDYEGMPNALMEAMAVGTPAVSTDCPCGGPRTLVETPEQGLLVPCGDGDALAKAMLTVLGDRDLQQQMSAAAARRARQFQPEIILKEWEAFVMQ